MISINYKAKAMSTLSGLNHQKKSQIIMLTTQMIIHARGLVRPDCKHLKFVTHFRRHKRKHFRWGPPTHPRILPVSKLKVQTRLLEFGTWLAAIAWQFWETRERWKLAACLCYNDAISTENWGASFWLTSISFQRCRLRARTWWRRSVTSTRRSGSGRTCSMSRY